MGRVSRAPNHLRPPPPPAPPPPPLHAAARECVGWEVGGVRPGRGQLAGRIRVSAMPAAVTPLWGRHRRSCLVLGAR